MGAERGLRLLPFYTARSGFVEKVMSEQGLEGGSPEGIWGRVFRAEGTASAKALGQEGALVGLSDRLLEGATSLICGCSRHRGNPQDVAAVNTTKMIFTPKVPEVSGPSGSGDRHWGPSYLWARATTVWPTLPSAEEPPAAPSTWQAVPAHTQSTSPSTRPPAPATQPPALSFVKSAEMGPAQSPAQNTRVHSHLPTVL